jgi:hypothetical protein
MSNESYIGNYSSGSQLAEMPRAIPHGASVEIRTTCNLSAGQIRHRSPNELSGEVCRVVSYSDGMIVGCTFITNEALEKLWEFHQRYLKDKQSLKHQ